MIVARMAFVTAALALAVLCGYAETHSSHVVLEECATGVIRPAGHLKTFLERQRTGITGNREVLGYPFDGCMWGGIITNVYFEEDLPYSRKIVAPRDDIWWPYEQSAYLLDGMIRLSQLIDAPELKSEFKRSLDFCIEHQAEDGDLFRVYSASGSRWPMVVFFRAALAYIDETGDEHAKAAFVRHFEGKRNAFQHPYDRDVLNIEGMLKVMEWTGDRSWLALAEKWFMEHFYFERFTHTDRVHSHGVTFAEMLKIPALLYIHSGDEKWKVLAEKAMREVFAQNETPNGQVSCCEYLSGRDPWEGSETCVLADMMWSLGVFLAMDANCEAADRMERIAYNALPGAMTKDFTAHQYISMPNQAVATPFSHGGHFFYGEPDWNRYRVCHFAQCCSGNINRAMPLFVQRMWMRRKSDGAPVSMLLGPSSVLLEKDGRKFSISCETDYPFGDRLCYTFHCDGTLGTPLLVRIPGWSEPPHLYKCGGEVSPRSDSGGLVEISGPWKDGDTLDVVLPQKVALESDRHWHWLRRGALTFAYPVKTQLIREKPDAKFSDLSFENPEPFNFAFDIEEISRTNLVAEKVSSTYPFEHPNLVVRVPMHEIKEWQGLSEGRFTPHIPLYTHPTGRKTTLDFVPYATTLTRITAFPDVCRRKPLPVVRAYVSAKCYDYDPTKPIALQQYEPEHWSNEYFMDKADVVQRSPDLWCDLEAHFHVIDRKMAYVLFRFWSDREESVTCALGVSRCAQAFFDGKEVYANGPIVEGRMVAPFWFKVTAKKGYNYLKVKVACGAGKEVVFGQDQYRREWGAKLDVFRED